MTYLANNPLFHGISPETLSRDFDGIVSHLRMFRKGDILARQGDVCNRLMILLKGSVRGEMIDYSGRLIKVEDITAPRAIAPLFLFGADNRYPVEVTANEATEIFEIPKESVLKLFRRNERFRKLYEPFGQLCPDTCRQTIFYVFQDDPAKTGLVPALDFKTAGGKSYTTRSLTARIGRLFRSVTHLTGTRTGTHAG